MWLHAWVYLPQDVCVCVCVCVCLCAFVENNLLCRIFLRSSGGLDRRPRCPFVPCIRFLRTHRPPNGQRRRFCASSFFFFWPVIYRKTVPRSTVAAVERERQNGGTHGGTACPVLLGR
uniref:Putative secreted protein n=1 Tax=Anopheles darlingi TaxID=43151 RepID=A0A2M4DKZ9_ANODA